MTDSNHTNFLLEDMNGKFDRLIEIVSQLSEQMKTTAKQSDLEELKSDIKIIKAAVTDVSHQAAKHEKQIADFVT